MNKNLKILIIGFGSIGKRHYHNLKKLGYNNLWIYDKKKIIANRQFNKLNLYSLKDFDIVFICSPSNLHVKQTLMAARAGCHVFIEKPLSNTLAGIDELSHICKTRKLVNMVGCNMRFHPCLNYIKNYLDKKRLGKIYTIHHETAYYLPFWRPGKDYSKNYAAKTSTGGGIILDAIHEFDLLFWLNNFNPVKQSKFIYGKLSDLEINTEDACIASFEFKNKVLGSIRCDYLQKSYERTCKIVGENGNLEWDWHENIVWLKSNLRSKKLFQVKKWDLNEMYLEEIKYFMDCVSQKKSALSNIQTGKQLLITILKK